MVDLPLASGTSSCTTPTSTSGGNTLPRPGGDDLIAHLGLGGALQIGEHAQAITGVVGAAGEDAVFPRAGHNARCVEAGMQDGHHLAAGSICLHHDAHKVALIADHGIAHGHTVHGAAVQRKAAKLIQRVAADHKAGNITGLAVGILNAGQRLVGFVFLP